MTIARENPGQAILSAVKQIPLNTVAAYAAYTIGDLGFKGEINTGQVWPRYPSNMQAPDGSLHHLARKNHQIHHIIPQEIGGPHVWWNAHPLAAGAAHQGGIHGSGSALNQILKELK